MTEQPPERPARRRNDRFQSLLDETMENVKMEESDSFLLKTGSWSKKRKIAVIGIAGTLLLAAGTTAGIEFKMDQAVSQAVSDMPIRSDSVSGREGVYLGGNSRNDWESVSLRVPCSSETEIELPMSLRKNFLGEPALEAARGIIDEAEKRNLDDTDQLGGITFWLMSGQQDLVDPSMILDRVTSAESLGSFAETAYSTLDVPIVTSPSEWRLPAMMLLQLAEDGQSDGLSSLPGCMDVDGWQELDGGE